jgi:hypothetical protein
MTNEQLLERANVSLVQAHAAIVAARHGDPSLLHEGYLQAQAAAAALLELQRRSVGVKTPKLAP